MKLLSYFSSILLLLLTFSCKKHHVEPISNNPLSKLKLVQTINNSNHKINIYASNGKLEQGYNNIFIQVKNQDGKILKPTGLTWQAMMHMTSMSHACPSIAPLPLDSDNSIFQGGLIFQMASNDAEYWDLTLQYMVDNVNYTAKDKINVNTTAKQRVTSFKGGDNVKYILALVHPTTPKVGTNDIEALLFKMDNMTTFSKVSNYTIKIDPRMPGMGNHGSPNNVNLTSSSDGRYSGKINFTMTGYWKINLQLLNETSTVLKGEAVAGSIEASSIYWEIEF